MISAFVSSLLLCFQKEPGAYKTVKKVFSVLGYHRDESGINTTNWDILWTHNYPYRVGNIQGIDAIESVKQHQIVSSTSKSITTAIFCLFIKKNDF